MPLRQPINVPIGVRKYQLVEDYAYVWRAGGRTRRIVVPAGFVYDGASVPRLGWTLAGILPDGLIRAAACVHDWIYINKGRLDDGSYQEFNHQSQQWVRTRCDVTREEADRMFCRIMREAGLPKWRRRIAYRAVRLGGWIPWRRDNRGELIRAALPHLYKEGE